MIDFVTFSIRHAYLLLLNAQNIYRQNHFNPDRETVLYFNSVASNYFKLLSVFITINLAFNIFIIFSVEVCDSLITFTIPDSKVEDSGTYTVKAENNYGVCECSAEVTLKYTAPYFPEPLQNVSTTVNTSATFICQAAGEPKPDTKWQISGMDLFESPKYHSENLDENRHTLTIKEITVDDAEMTYSCVVTSPAGRSETTAQIIIIEEIQKPIEDDMIDETKPVEQAATVEELIPVDDDIIAEDAPLVQLKTTPTIKEEPIPLDETKPVEQAAVVDEPIPVDDDIIAEDAPLVQLKTTPTTQGWSACMKSLPNIFVAA